MNATSAAIIGLSFLASARAEARIEVRNSEALTCSELVSIIEKNQEVVLVPPSKGGIELHEVAYAVGCPDRTAASKPLFVSTSDEIFCLAGFRCTQMTH